MKAGGCVSEISVLPDIDNMDNKDNIAILPILSD